MQPHEYSVQNHSRAVVGRYVSIAAGILTALLASLITLLSAVGLFKGISGLIILPINAATFFVIGHTLFDKWFWKTKLGVKLLNIPDLNGNWLCEGTTKDMEGNTTHQWQATVTIVQTWEKIRIYLNTGQSSSRSKTASIVQEPGRGYVLMYSYQNEPRIGEPELRTHVGYCELQFSEDLTEAEGDYFNNKGRITFGRMTLTRGPNNG